MPLPWDDSGRFRGPRYVTCRILPHCIDHSLAIHGDADRILLIDAANRRLATDMKGIKLVELKNGPHGILRTHAAQVDAELVGFLE
jgi:hypothetical protein